MAVNSNKKTELRDSARKVLGELWNAREDIFEGHRELGMLIPIPADVIIRSLLNITLEEPEEIPSPRRGYETAGFMDRASNLIVIAQKYRPEWRRFTMAHEIAHWVIHPSVTYHRDRPVTGAEAADLSRPDEEQEADFFASELLMPYKSLNAYFMQAFGQPVCGTAQNHSLATWLSVGTGRPVNEIEFNSSTRYRALVIAQTKSYGPTQDFVPLAKRFGVSATAMAIRLEHLGLVV